MAKSSHQLFDITGQVISVYLKYRPNGKVFIDELQQLPSGNYLLNVSGMKTKSTTVKLIKE